MKDKKNVFKFIAVVAIGLLSIYYLYAKTDPERLGAILPTLDWKYMVMAALSFLMFLGMEALAFRYMLGKRGYRVTLRRTYGYSLADYFFSSISPGGSAGQPGQYFFMQRDNITPASCVMSLFTFNIVYHVVMLMLAGWALAMGATAKVTSLPAMKYMVIYGAIMQVNVLVLETFLMFSKKLVPRFVNGVFRTLGKFKIFKHLNDKKAKVEEQLAEHKACGEYLKQNPLVFLRMFLYVLPLLMFSYAIPYWIYRAQGYAELGIFEMIAIQSVIILAVESIPLPGGVGVSEGSLLAVYSMFIAENHAFGLMLLTRSLSFYLGMFMGGLAVLKMKKLHLTPDGSDDIVTADTITVEEKISETDDNAINFDKLSQNRA